VLLGHTTALVREAGWQVANVDVTVMAERPRLADAREEMRNRLAGVLGVDVGAVSVKATRGEGLGPEGRGEGLTVHAVALLAPVGQ
jgi:2-C-methyl-D-erythritol 2,4-cyclodiphosphate synthase